MTLLQLGTIINSSGFAMAVLHDHYIRRITSSYDFAFDR